MFRVASCPIVPPGADWRAGQLRTYLIVRVWRRGERTPPGVLGRLLLALSTVSVSARAPFVTRPKCRAGIHLAKHSIDCSPFSRSLHTRRASSCSHRSRRPRDSVCSSAACVHADQHSANPASKDRQRARLARYPPPKAAHSSSYSTMGKGGQRPPSDADKGLIASEYGCQTPRGK